MDFKKRIIFFVGLLWLTLATVGNAHESLHKDLIVSVELVSAYPDQFGRIEIQVSYKNPTSRSITALRRGTALDGGVFTDLLNVSLDGRSLPYIGPIFKRLKPNVSDYVTIAAYRSVSEIVEIQDAYDFSKIGLYTVTAKQHANRKVEVIQNPVLIAVSSPPLKSKRPPTFAGCSDSQRRASDDALLWAERYAINARNALSGTPAKSRARSPRYTTWYGSYDLSRWNRVQSNWNKIANTLTDKTIAYNCACDAPGIDQSDTVAYVYPSRPYEINLCPIFFRLRTTGTNSQAGVVIHEVSHFSIVSGTKDHVYGTSGAKNLARSSPAQAIENADSYEYFGENPGNLSMTDSGAGTTPTPGEDDNTVISPVPEDPVKPDYSFLTVINNLLLGESVFELPPNLVLPDSPSPSIPTQGNGKYNIALNLSRTDIFAFKHVSKRHRYSQANSYIDYYNRSPDYVYLQLRGFGVEGEDLKTDDKWELALRAKNGSRFEPGVYHNVSQNPFAGPSVILRHDESRVYCDQEMTQRYRIYDAEYHQERLIKLVFDFSINCSGSEPFSIEGALHYDETVDDLKLPRKQPDEMSAKPFLKRPSVSGVSFAVQRFHSLEDQSPFYAAEYGPENVIARPLVSTRSMSIPMQTDNDSLSFTFNYPNTIAKPINNYTQYADLVDSYEYLLGQLRYAGTGAGIFKLRFNGEECPSSVSKVDIQDIQLSGFRLSLSFDHLCQETGIRTIGNVLIDNTLPRPSPPPLGPIEGSPSNVIPPLSNSTTVASLEINDGRPKVFEYGSSFINLEHTLGEPLTVTFGAKPEYQLQFEPYKLYQDIPELVGLQTGLYTKTAGSIDNPNHGVHILSFQRKNLPSSVIHKCDSSFIAKTAKVYQVEYDESELVKLVADFEFDCGVSLGYIKLSLRYDQTLPEIPQSELDSPAVLAPNDVPNLPPLSANGLVVKVNVDGEITEFNEVYNESSYQATYDNDSSAGFKILGSYTEPSLFFRFERAKTPTDRNIYSTLVPGVYNVSPSLDFSVVGITSYLWMNRTEMDCSDYDEIVSDAQLKIYEIEYNYESFPLTINKFSGTAIFDCVSKKSNVDVKHYSIDFRYNNSF